MILKGYILKEWFKVLTCENVVEFLSAGRTGGCSDSLHNCLGDNEAVQFELVFIHLNDLECIFLE